MLATLDAGTATLALVPAWFDDAGRLFWSTVLTLGLLGIATAYLVLVPKSERPATWAQSMAGAVFVFALFILGYGVVPSEWIIYANAYLRWDESSFIFEQSAIIPFSMTKNVARDVVAVLIYGFFFVTNVGLWILWQQRKTAAERAATTEEAAPSGTSAYGRPVTKQV